MKTISKILIFVSMSLALSGCDDFLTKEPETNLSPNTFFSSEAELELWTNRFYSLFAGPDTDAIQVSDIQIAKNLSSVQQGTRSPATENWGTSAWAYLRYINYYLERSGNCSDETVRQRYDGVAYFFRALFYFEKVRKYGDIPYYDFVIPSNDWASLKRPRDSRGFVMKKDMEDLDRAITDLPDNWPSDALYRLSKNAARAMKARAALYEGTFRKYHGIADETIDAKSVDRHTVQENIDFMVGELDAIKNDLPVRTDDIGIDGKQWAGRVTRGAALALKSRILLYAASPLYNGCDLYKGQMQNIRGEFLFPQSKDETKWEAAAQAAWDVIELAETGLYDLYKDTEQTDEFTRYMSSYQGVRLKPWNKETIWGWWSRSGGYSWLGGTGGLLAGAMPGMTSGGASGVVYQGYGGIQPSLKLVDSYPMYTTGRYPVTGYQGENDMSKPIVDPQSGYQATGFTEGYKQPGIDWGDGIKAHNSCINRDPRYYACLVPNGFWWPNKTENIKFTCYNNDACTNKWNAGEGGGITRVG